MPGVSKSGQHSKRMAYSHDEPSARSMAADDAAAGADSVERGPEDVHPALTPFTVLNVRGLKPRTVPSKVPLISDIIYDTSHIFIGLTETWLYDHQDAELNIDGFTLFRQDRQRKKIHNRSCYSGGVALYINNKDAIDSEINFTFSNGVIAALGIHVKSRNLVVIIVYRQPDDPEGKHRSGSKEFKNLLNELSVEFSNLPSPTPDVLLCGDFNLPHAVWSNGTCST